MYAVFPQLTYLMVLTKMNTIMKPNLKGTLVWYKKLLWHSMIWSSYCRCNLPKTDTHIRDNYTPYEVTTQYQKS